MKPALCIPTPHELPFSGVQPLPESFFGPFTQTMLRDRAECETNEAYQQLIPYIVLTKPDGSIYCYSRGGAGGEARLYSKLSVGLGGHVDEAQGPGPRALYTLLQMEAAREVFEEVGIDIPADFFSFCEMIVDRSDAVGRVHLGLLSVIQVPQDIELRCEDKVIEHGSFVDLESLALPATFDRLENWSKHVVTYLRGRKPAEGKNVKLLKLAAEYFRGDATTVIDDTAALVKLLERLAGSKERLNDGSKFDNPCFVNAGEMEPIFTTRAQDTLGSRSVRQWAFAYRAENATPHPVHGWSWTNPSQKAKFEGALMVAEAMDNWPFRKAAD